MESIIAFFERLVSEFSWRRLGLVLGILTTAIVCIWLYESFTGHFRSSRMRFAAEHLEKLADPQLKMNVQGDKELEKAYENMKSGLNRFLDQSYFGVGLPDPVLRVLAAAFPWVLLGIAMFCVTEKGEFLKVLGGLLILAIPIIIVAAMLPAFDSSWINYFGYPFGSVVLVLAIILTWTRVQKRMRKCGTQASPPTS